MNSDEKSVGITLTKRSVFVSHASKNFKVANEVRTLLEEQGISCWIAPRDIPPGGQYGTSIVEAIRECTIVVLLLTDEANKSKPVENEIERAFNHQKTIVPIRLREITPSKGLEFFVSNAQWVDAIVSPLKGRIDQIVNIVHAIELDKPLITPEPEVPTLLGRVERKLEQALRHKVLSVSVAFAVLVLLIASVLGVQVATQGGLQMASTSISKSADRIDGAANTLELTSATIKGMDAKLDNVEKEVSDDPRKELVKRGYTVDGNGLEKAMLQKDLTALENFNKSGYVPSYLEFNEFLFGEGWDPKVFKTLSSKLIGIPGKCIYWDVPLSYGLKHKIDQEKINFMVARCGKDAIIKNLKNERSKVDGAVAFSMNSDEKKEILNDGIQMKNEIDQTIDRVIKLKN